MKIIDAHTHASFSESADANVFIKKAKIDYTFKGFQKETNKHLQKCRQ